VSVIVPRLVEALKAVEMRTGTRPQVAHIGRDLWVDLCAASNIGLLPPGTFIELDGCTFEFRDNLPPTEIYFEPASATREREQLGGTPHGQLFGWASQLVKHKWVNVGPGRWQRDGKAAVSTDEAIAIEKREAADRQTIKDRMAVFTGDPMGGMTQKQAADRVLRQHGIKVPS
jgi:hypothetical protein